MKTAKSYPIKSLKIHKIDRQEYAKEQAKALVEHQTEWLRNEVSRLKSQLKNKEYRRAIVSSKHTALKADVRKIIVRLKKTYQLNA